jgi:hypothetical protein
MNHDEPHQNHQPDLGLHAYQIPRLVILLLLLVILKSILRRLNTKLPLRSPFGAGQNLGPGGHFSLRKRYWAILRRQWGCWMVGAVGSFGILILAYPIAQSFVARRIFMSTLFAYMGFSLV